MRQSVAFSDAALQRRAVRLRQRAFREHLDVHVAQKLASRAFAAVNRWVPGQRGRPRFKGYRQLDTVEGKSNHTGIRWRGGHVEWLGLSLPAILNPRDPVIVHALDCRVKYVRLVRRKLGGQDWYYAQLSARVSRIASRTSGLARARWVWTSARPPSRSSGGRGKA